MARARQSLWLWAAALAVYAFLYLPLAVVVLLGDADTDPHHAALRHTPEADAQGLHRFARGRFFFARVQAAAAALAAPCNWTLATAPGIAHSNKGMAPFAARQLFPE